MFVIVVVDDVIVVIVVVVVAYRNGKRAFIFLRFFLSLLVFSHILSLLPASSGGPAGRIVTFLPVSSLFVRVSSRFSPPLRAGRRDDF